MKKLFVLCLSICILFSLGAIAGAKTLKVGLDAGPVSQDPQVQLSGGMLQYSHWVALTPVASHVASAVLLGP